MARRHRAPPRERARVHVARKTQGGGRADGRGASAMVDSATFGGGVFFLMLNAAVLLNVELDSWSRYDVLLTLAASLAAAVGCAAAHGLSAEQDMVAPVLALAQLATLGYNTLVADDAGGIGRWVTSHIAAALGALVLLTCASGMRVLAKVRRWNRALKRAEANAAGIESVPPSSPPRRRTSKVLGMLTPRRQASNSADAILILYASVGSGHKRAAQAVEAALLARGADPGRVQLLDALDLCPKAFKYVMQTMFQQLTQSLAGQHLLGVRPAQP